jgi:hypothetical protein
MKLRKKRKHVRPKTPPVFRIRNRLSRRLLGVFFLGSNEGVRLGNWLTQEARALWQLPNIRTLRGTRERAMFAALLGCGLRRRELPDLDLNNMQPREEHWAIVDLTGKVGMSARFQCRTG